MPDTKISALSSASALAGTETLPVVQSATTKKTTAQSIADLKASLAPGLIAGSIAGQYYAPMVQTGSIAVNATSFSTLTAVPIALAPAAYDAIAVAHFGTPTADEVFRVGLYADNGKGYPGALVANTEGTVDLSTAAAVKTSAITLTLTVGGLYWLVGVKQGPTNAATMLCWGAGTIYPMGAIMPVNSDLTTHPVAFTQASVTGALPSTFTASLTAKSVNNDIAVIAIRAA